MSGASLYLPTRAGVPTSPQWGMYLPDPKSRQKEKSEFEPLLPDNSEQKKVLPHNTSIVVPTSRLTPEETGKYTLKLLTVAYQGLEPRTRWLKASCSTR